MISGCTNDIPQVIISDNQAEMALDIAINLQNKSYKWGGRGPNEFDCSGLITWSYKKVAGRNNIFKVDSEQTTDATMKDLYYWNVSKILPEQMRPGDIVFITKEKGEITHGGLFIRWIDKSTFEFINASSYYDEVVIDSWSINGMKRGQWFIGAGRLKIAY